MRSGFLAYPYYFEFGNRSENHDILTLALYLLSGEMLPARRFCAGAEGRELFSLGRRTFLTWIEDLYTAGFSEWGSAEYYGVYIMA